MSEIILRKTFTGDTLDLNYSNIYSLRNDVNALKNSLESLKDNVSDIRKDVTTLKTELFELKRDVAANTKEIIDLKSDLRDWRTETKGAFHTQNTRIDGIDKRFDDLNKRFDDLHQSQNKWFTLFGILIALVPLITILLQSFIAK